MFATVRYPRDGGSWLSLTFFRDDPRAKEYPEAGFCVGFDYTVPEAVDLFAGLPRPPASAPELEPPDPGKWQVSRSTNPIDDSPTVVLTLRADSGQSTYGESIVFIARCQSNTTEAYIIWNDYLGDDSSRGYDQKYVTVRIGDAAPEEQTWGISTDSEATFAPGWAGNLLKRMLESGRLVVRTTPYNENPVTAIFDTSGLHVVLPELAETCHWSP